MRYSDVCGTCVEFTYKKASWMESKVFVALSRGLLVICAAHRKDLRAVDENKPQKPNTVSMAFSLGVCGKRRMMI